MTLQGFIWAKNFEAETGAMAGLVDCLSSPGVGMEGDVPPHARSTEA